MMRLIQHSDIVTNGRGCGLADYRVRVVTSEGNIVPLFADPSGTPLSDGEGRIVDYASTDAKGHFAFYWQPASGQVLQVCNCRGSMVSSTPGFGDRFVLANLAGCLPLSRVEGLEQALESTALEADMQALVQRVTALEAMSPGGGPNV